MLWLLSLLVMSDSRVRLPAERHAGLSGGHTMSAYWAPSSTMCPRGSACDHDSNLACSARYPDDDLGTAILAAGGALLVPGMLAAYNEVFDSACKTHDRCYRYGSASYGLSRHDCDNEFLANMRDICNGVIIIVTTADTCRAVADAYYKGVRDVGAGSYHGPGSGWCCPYDDNRKYNNACKEGSTLVPAMLLLLWR
jgi:hypothetical protein